MKNTFQRGTYLDKVEGFSVFLTYGDCDRYVVYPQWYDEKGHHRINVRKCNFFRRYKLIRSYQNRISKQKPILF